MNPATAAYPHFPGHQATDTSRLAADSIRHINVTLAIRVCRELASAPLISYEIADRLRVVYDTAQPRVSELRALGVIEPSGAYGVTPYGKKAIRWRLRPGPYRPDLHPRLAAALADLAEQRLRNTTPEFTFAACQ